MPNPAGLDARRPETQSEFCCAGINEIRLYAFESPVQDTDQDLHRSACDRKDILEPEQARRQRQVGKQTQDECQGSQTETKDGQVLEVPAISVIDGVWIGFEPPERVCEAGKSEKLCAVSSPVLAS